MCKAGDAVIFSFDSAILRFTTSLRVVCAVSGCRGTFFGQGSACVYDASDAVSIHQCPFTCVHSPKHVLQKIASLHRLVRVLSTIAEIIFV